MRTQPSITLPLSGYKRVLTTVFTNTLTAIALAAGYLFFAIVLAAIATDKSFALTPGESRHLLERTGFGVTPQEIARLRDMTREQAVDDLLTTLDAPFYTRPPAFIAQPYPDYWAEGWMEQQVIFQRINELNQLQAWWIQEMMLTPAPFAERLTLFWHNHFVSRFDNTHITAPFFDQLRLFRTLGSQNFRTLTRQILRDPMMLSGLDNTSNTRQRPNENLARELMELFTLGIGHYSENDVKQVAKVLAGHGVNADDQWRYQFTADNAVPGDKIVLGKRISGTPSEQIDRLVDILLAQPQTANRLAGKFYAEFVATQPDPQAIAALAQTLRENDYAIRPFLRALLLSPAFWRQQNHGSLIKSPLDLVIGFSRTFALNLPDQQVLLDYLARLGQSPFMAPSVAGWRSGTQWLNSRSLVERTRVLHRLWQAVENPGAPHDDDGLSIRFSSEHAGLPVRFIIMADDKKIATVTAKLGVNTRQELGSSEPGNLKPMWETVAIPRHKLPDNPRTIAIIMDAEEPGSNLFVNWISLRGYRFSPGQARWIIPDGSACRADSPLGSFYCNLALSFDVTRPIDSDRATLEDRQTPINSNIEYGTGRLQTRLAAAGKPTPALRRPAPQHILPPYLLATAPFMAPKPSAAAAQYGHDEIKALTLDPAYNLK
ncbi:DUF1800 domain-containing protein [Brenneria tiliae]|uniref:DUF1800 domain-containing protein n=1 Tax=Brenneria tiliae TaxID=2914984 RepID=A0ABT0MQI4_9GAMM|nr:DUF1800 domain-containing protein [Brenneria tiliae]MCL2892106.1 DUF1800 domain-containing protein [Brenneria tiliae]